MARLEFRGRRRSTCRNRSGIYAPFAKETAFSWRGQFPLKLPTARTSATPDRQKFAGVRILRPPIARTPQASLRQPQRCNPRARTNLEPTSRKTRRNPRPISLTMCRRRFLIRQPQPNSFTPFQRRTKGVAARESQMSPRSRRSVPCPARRFSGASHRARRGIALDVVGPSEVNVRIAI